MDKQCQSQTCGTTLPHKHGSDTPHNIDIDTMYMLDAPNVFNNLDTAHSCWLLLTLRTTRYQVCA